MTVDEPFSILRARLTLEYLQRLFSQGTVRFELLYEHSQRHPSSYALYNYGVAALGRKIGLGFVASHHLPNVLVYCAGVLFLFLLGDEVFDRLTAGLATVFFVFYPRLIAHAHYNEKDMPAMVFTLIALYFFYRATRSGRLVQWTICGLVTGIGIVTKFDALFVIPIVVLGALVLGQKDRKPFLRTGIGIGLCLGTTALTTYALWPYLWGNPLFLFRSIGHFLSEYQNFEVLYLGRLYSNSQLPWHYFPLYLLLVTPLAMIGCASFGLYLAIRDAKQYSWLLVWLFLPIVARSLPGFLKYDGIRHLFIVVPPLAILAGRGAARLLERVSRRRNLFVAASFLAVTVVMFLELRPLHPYEGSYFNRALRWAIPAHLERWFHLDYWGSSYKEGVAWLDRHGGQAASVYLPLFPELSKAYPRRTDLEYTWNPDSRYIMYVTRYSNKLKPDQFDEIPVVFTVNRYDSELLRIHRRP